MPFDDVYYGVTSGFEGGYVNDPDDGGGETFRGVSRRSHPRWEGWALIDAAKKKVGTRAYAINDHFKDDANIAALVADVYHDGYWKPLGGEPELPDRVRQKLFDTAVNTGQKPAVKILQLALRSLGSRLAVDGVLGPLTRIAATERDQDGTLGKFAYYQAQYYKGLAEKNPKNAKFLKGWLRRAAWVPK